jgi:hypothetical protein
VAPDRQDQHGHLRHGNGRKREDKEGPRRLSAQFGLTHLDANWLADEDGISSLTPQDEDAEKRGEFIPYTHHRIRWHTDGYYNPPERRIFAMTLHCVSRRTTGGENDLMDHELAYIALRDANPEHVRALMAPDAMTIPARVDEMGVAREDETARPCACAMASCICATPPAPRASPGNRTRHPGGA